MKKLSERKCRTPASDGAGRTRELQSGRVRLQSNSFPLSSNSPHFVNSSEMKVNQCSGRYLLPLSVCPGD